MNEQPEIRRRQRRIDLAGIAACLSITITAYILGLAPLLEKRSDLSGQRQTLAAKREEGRTINASLMTLKDQAIEVRDELAALDVTLQSKDRINHRLAELTDILGSCDLQIDRVQTGRIHPGPYCDMVPIQVSGRCTYLECIEALAQLHSTLADLSLVGVRVEAAPDSSQTRGQVVLDMVWLAAPGQTVAKGGS